MKMYVYGLAETKCDVTEIKYIGIAHDLKSRLSQHKSDKSSTAKVEWINGVKSSNGNIHMVLLGEVNGRKDAHALENSWITFAKRRGWDLVNSTRQSDWRDMFSEDFDTTTDNEMRKIDADIDELKVLHQQEIDRLHASYHLKLEELARKHNNEIIENNKRSADEKRELTHSLNGDILTLKHSAKTLYNIIILVFCALYTILIPLFIMISMPHDHELWYIPVEILAWSVYGWAPGLFLLCFPMYNVVMPNKINLLEILRVFKRSYLASENRFVINQMMLRVVGGLAIALLSYYTS